MNNMFDQERERIEGRTKDGRAKRIQKGLIIAEVGLDELTNVLCAEADAANDWQGDDAQDMARLAAIGHQMRALHWELALIAQRRLGWDIPPNEGDR